MVVSDFAWIISGLLYDYQLNHFAGVSTDYMVAHMAAAFVLAVGVYWLKTDRHFSRLTCAAFSRVFWLADVWVVVMLCPIVGVVLGLHAYGKRRSWLLFPDPLKVSVADFMETLQDDLGKHYDRLYAAVLQKAKDKTVGAFLDYLTSDMESVKPFKESVADLDESTYLALVLNDRSSIVSGGPSGAYLRKVGWCRFTFWFAPSQSATVWAAMKPVRGQGAHTNKRLHHEPENQKIRRSRWNPHEPDDPSRAEK
jgi:hypothetical protein